MDRLGNVLCNPTRTPCSITALMSPRAHQYGAERRVAHRSRLFLSLGPAWVGVRGPNLTAAASAGKGHHGTSMGASSAAPIVVGRRSAASARKPRWARRSGPVTKRTVSELTPQERVRYGFEKPAT
jgi:hypothetical protein